MAEIELYGYETGNSFRAAIALEEAGVPYRSTRIDLRQRQHHSAAFLALNPRGQVPIVVTTSADGSRKVLTQSNAIMMLAAELAPGKLLAPLGSDARMRAFERYFYFVTDVIAPSHAAFALASVAGGDDSAAALNQRSLSALTMAETFLRESPCIAGDHFTIADISAYTIVLASQALLDWSALPNLRRWYGETGSRPGVHRGLHAFDEPSKPLGR